MKYRIRLEEDWILLGLIVLLGAFAVLALNDGLRVMALLAAAFAGAVALIQWRLMRARWCRGCEQPMRALASEERDDATQRYVCDHCGRRHDSGVQLRWPE